MSRYRWIRLAPGSFWEIAFVFDGLVMFHGMHTRYSIESLAGKYPQLEWGPVIQEVE